MFNLIERQWFHYIMKIRETSYFPSWIGRQTKLKPTNRAHILDIFNTYYGNRVKSDSIVVHRGSFKWGGGIRKNSMPGLVLGEAILRGGIWGNVEEHHAWVGFKGGKMERWNQV